MGQLLLGRIHKQNYQGNIFCWIRSNSRQNHLPSGLFENQVLGNCEIQKNWFNALNLLKPGTIIHIASLRHVPVILNTVAQSNQKPRLIIVGTTGVYSQYNQYSAEYQQIEQQLKRYPGQYCLLRPTMIYGSHRDKNLHKLIQFCDRYSFFPVFGSGQNLLQPAHADDLAQAILSVFLNPDIEGDYDLSGGSVVTFNELIVMVGKLLEKSVRPLKLPYRFGLWSATLSEKILGKRSPVRREQILRLQEDKAYSHEAAKRDFGYQPRSLDVGLKQEIEILRHQGMIS